MNWPLSWRLARRELRGGLAGFRVLILCLALGVAAIASLNAAITAVTSAGYAPQVRGVLWSQGEQDAERLLEADQPTADVGRVEVDALPCARQRARTHQREKESNLVP
jgi:predicted lysophospholipase L1 biosynthesis ABC-type transport system permease subunit